MWKLAPVFFCFLMLISCDVENGQHVNADSAKDSTPIVEVPQFDISGEFELTGVQAMNDWTTENGERVVTMSELTSDDSVFFQYKAAHPCEECHVELQFWRNDKYVDVVRDTGFGVGSDYIPASVFINASKFGTQEYGRLALYLSVRQYHPVETGNKRFLCYVELK